MDRAHDVMGGDGVAALSADIAFHIGVSIWVAMAKELAGRRLLVRGVCRPSVRLLESVCEGQYRIGWHSQSYSMHSVCIGEAGTRHRQPPQRISH